MQKTPTPCDVIILTALSVECKAVLYHLQDQEEVVHSSGTIYYQGMFTGNHRVWRVAVAEIGMGGVAAALEAEKAISFFHTEVALFVGIAGGIKDVKRGDVVAATKIYAYESGKAGERFDPRPELGRSSHALEQRARAEGRSEEWLTRLEGDRPDPAPQVFIGALAAGEKVLASMQSDIARLLKETYGDTLAIEMEGHGFLHAIRVNQQVYGLVIRGISDLIDDKAEADVSGAQRGAAQHAAAFAFQVIAKFTLPERNDAATHSAIWNVPFARNPFFTGRENLLQALYEQLHKGRSIALSQPPAISGLGGVGKTQLAVEYAYRHRREYQYVLWARAESIEALTSSYIALAEALKLPEHNERDQDIIVQGVKRWLQEHQRWLLILDNADELELLPPFLPSEWEGHLLLTTRVAETQDLATCIELTSLTSEDGAHLLLRRAKYLEPDMSLGQTTLENRELARQISMELGGLPLALDQAGAYIAATQSGLSGYLQVYRQHHAELLKRRGSLRNDYLETVSTTWLLNFQRVEEKNPAAVELLWLCAFLAPDSIPEEIFTKGAGPLSAALASVAADGYQFDEAIAALRSYSLLARDPRTCTLSVHRLVQAVLRSNMATKGDDKEWMRRAVLAVNTVFPLVEFTQWPTCERLTPHALACAFWIEQEHMAFPEALRLLHQTGHYLEKRSRYPEAERLLKVSLLISEQDSSVGPEITTTSMNALAGIYGSQGRYQEAEALYQRSLEICKQYLGFEHPSTIHNLNDLGYLYEMQEKYKEAEALYQSSLALSFAPRGFDLQILQQCGELLSQANIALEQQIEAMRSSLKATTNLELLPINDSDLQTLNNLASLYVEQGRFKEAEPLCRLVLVLREQFLGAEHPDTGASLGNLAAWYRDQGRFEEAEPLYQRVLAIYEKQQPGSEHPDTAPAFHNIAGFYVEQGRYEEAELLYQHAQTIQERRLGDNPVRMTMILFALANLYETQGKYVQAQSLYQQLLAIREKYLGPMHSRTAQSLNSLGMLYGRQSQYEQATILLKRALTIWEQQSRRSDTTIGLTNLAAIYKAQGKYRQAETLFKHALAIREECSGTEHPDTAMSLNNLGELHCTQGKYKEAEPLLKRALTIWEQQPRPHQNMAYILNNLAVLYREQGKYKEAEPLLKRALTIWEQQLGAEHLHVAASLSNLANLYEMQEEYERAEPLVKRALAIVKKFLGEEHPDTAVMMNNLAGLYESQAKYAEAEKLYLHVLAICEQQLGKEHDKTATCLNNLGYLYMQQERYTEALPLYRRALHIQEQILGSDHPDVGSTLNNLANLYAQQEMYTDAEPLLKRALRIWEQMGATHPFTQITRRNYASLLRVMGRDEEAARLEGKQPPSL